jgi:tetratricopeptide (TPR) repeat protein
MIGDSEDPETRVQGWNVLCAVEGDERNLDAMYKACQAAIEDDRIDGDVEPIFFTNAAEAARALLLADEAEEMMLEATEHFHASSVAIPWTDLMLFYVSQARLSEAVDAMREAQRWRRRQHPYTGALTWALQDLNAAHLLLVVGRADVAAELSRRALERSDRYGRISTAQEEREGWANLFDRAAHQTLAEAYAEEASWSGWRDSVVAHGKGLGHRFRAWQAGRRFVANFADRGLLESRLIPHAPGRVSMPEWLELDLVELLGPGVVEVAMRRLGAEPPPDAMSFYVMAFAAESARVSRRHSESLDRAMLALQGLPRWEVLLRARLAAGAGASAFAQGRAGEAAQFFDLAWQNDPGVIRRLGLALPTRFAASGGPAARDALELLQGSPRFERANTGFEVRVEQQGDTLIGCLHGPHGAVLRCADARPGARSAVEKDPLPVQLARAFHEQAFAPRVDLTQLDIRSLDGSNVVSGGDDARVRSVLDELLGGTEEAVTEE